MKKRTPKKVETDLKSTILIVLIGAIVAALFTGSFSSRLSTQKQNSKAVDVTTPEGWSSVVRAKAAPSAAMNKTEKTPHPENPTWKIPEETRQLITECLKKDQRLSSFLAEPMTLDELINSLSAQNDTKHEVSLMNIHVRSADSKILRLHLSQKESNNLESSSEENTENNIDSLKVQLFSVDKENLPVPEALPQEMEVLTPTQSIESFKGQGTVVLEESVQRINWENKSNNYQASADITETNGHIRDMQIFFGDSSLGCAWRDANSNVSTLEDQSIHCKCL